MKLVFDPWRAFTVKYKQTVVLRFLHDVAKTSETKFRRGVKNPPKTGRLYLINGRQHQASSQRTEAEYPANLSGQLLKSIKSKATANTATVGSNAPHSIYLREGTRNMNRRKMSDSALKEAVPEARRRMGRWAVFTRGGE